MHYPIDRLGQGTALQADAYTAIGSRLEQLGYTTGPLPGDRESLVEAYLALRRARGERVAAPVPEDDEELINAITVALDGRFCGVPDGQQLLVSGVPRGRMDRGDLTWSVSRRGCQWIDPIFTIMQSIEDGLAPWAEALPSFFRFTRVSRGADIRFSFTADTERKHGVPGGTLATGGYPDADERGRVRFDSAEKWDRDLLAAVTTHEVGHVLGLTHSSVNGSTMFPFQARRGPLDQDTRNTLLDMYGWTPVRRFPDNRASSDGPALTTTHNMSFQQANTRVHMVWKGVEGHSQVHISTSQDDGLSWGPQIPLPGIRSSHGPAITGYRSSGSPSPDDLFLAWKGEGSDERLFYARGFNGSSFATVERLEGHSSNARPAVAEFQGRVHMVWKAATGEHVLWSSWANGSWAPVKVIPNVFTTHAPALAPFGNDLILCWKGMGADTRIFVARLPGGAADWLTGQPATTLSSFARGSDFDVSGEAVNTSHHPAMASTESQLVVAYKGQPGDDAVWLFRGVNIVGPVPIKDALSSAGPGIATVRDKVICVWKAQAPDQELHFSVR